MRGQAIPTKEDNFFDRIKMAAYRKGWTLKELEKISGVSYNTMLKQREEPVMRAYNLITLCEMLDVSADYLLFGKSRRIE